MGSDLRKIFNYGLRSGVAFAALAAGVAHAQTAVPDASDGARPQLSTSGTAVPPAPAEAGQVASDIVVTGSRIRGVAPIGSPIIEQTRADLVATGSTSTTQLVQNLPQVLNQGVTENGRNTSGGAGNITYSSGFDIHGIGPYATLTLLNGHRMVQSGSSGGLPDPSAVPTIALERVEIVADGASAIYGSDAVAGVVNLITRRHFDGLEARAQYGLTDDNAYNQYTAGIIAGHSWKTGNITGSYEHNGHGSLNGNDRPFYGANLTSRGGGDYRGVQCNPANVVIGGVSYAQPGLVAGTSNKCDTLKGQDLIPSQVRDSFMGSVTQEIGSRITLTGDVLYTHRKFVFTPTVTTATLTVPSTNPYFVLPAGVAATSETVQTNFGGTAPLNASSGFSKTLEATAGLNVKLFGDFQLDAAYTYGHDDSYSLSNRGVNNGALAAALASSDKATALNPFGTSPASVINTVFNSVFGAPGANTEEEGEINLSGSLLTLPGGNLRAAIGGEIIRESIYNGLDSGIIGAVVASRSSTSRTIKSYYGELRVPIFGVGNAIPGFYALDISLAGRISDYSDVGTARNPKIGVNWEPVHGLKLHGSYGTSFRAPILTQIHGASNALYVQNYSTPAGIVQGVTLSGFAAGNPLTPENARTFSFGADLTPQSMTNFRASVNYFNVNYKGQINAILSDLSILQTPAIAAQYADRIVQGAAAAALVQSFVAQGYPVRGVLPATPTLFVYGQNVNAGTVLAEGLDFQVAYRLGDFNLATSGTYFLKYNSAVSKTAPLLDTLNTIYYPPRFRSRSSVGYDNGANSALMFWNFTNSYSNNRATPTQSVNSYSTFDLHLAHRFTGGPIARGKLTVALDVANLFDADPPFVNIPQSPNGGGGFDPTAANPIGRLISLSATFAL
ncbi:TonB-dependent receptor domain-containing protein [Glacieibacterium megasporae]|uniref:TonB-dependent receptor domain-containing protein n=1 Tax=Glacieibacterium megasporae TaxID=2835787 RepID=UPI001C1DEEDD|nr:TonB-dependent receptor [Polymorphobacter megasporae]UAJ11530.1 TonB-dependent receptor [Polymorphobacter megasporae]